MSIARVSSFTACLLVSAAGFSGAFAQVKPDYSATDIEKTFSCEELYDAPTLNDGSCGESYSDDPNPGRPWDPRKDRIGAPRPTPVATPATNRLTNSRPRAEEESAVVLLPQLSGMRDLLIEFDNDSAELTERAKANAQEFATALKGRQLSNVKFAIDGHTSASGGTAHNQDLSERRAKALVAYLETLGVDGTRFQVTGHGETRLIDTEDPDSPLNRRVEARRLDGPAPR